MSEDEFDAKLARLRQALAVATSDQFMVSNDTLWFVVYASVVRGRNGDDPREVADDILMRWQLMCAEVRVALDDELDEASGG